MTGLADLRAALSAAEIEVHVDLEHSLAAVRYSIDDRWELVLWPPDRDVCYMDLADWPAISAAVERVIADHARIQRVAEEMALNGVPVQAGDL